MPNRNRKFLNRIHRSTQLTRWRGTRNLSRKLRKIPINFQTTGSKAMFWCDTLDKTPTSLKQIGEQSFPKFSERKFFKNVTTTQHISDIQKPRRVCDRYWWPKMFKDVKDHVKGCNECGETKAPNYYLVAPMGKPRIPTVPFEMISMDFKGPFPRSTAGYSYLLVITVQLSKFVVLHRVRKTDAKTTVRIVEDHFLIFWVPRTLIHDHFLK